MQPTFRDPTRMYSAMHKSISFGLLIVAVLRLVDAHCT